MADSKDVGFLTSLGLGPVNENFILQQAAARGAPQGGGNVATFAQLGAQSGGLIAPAVGGLISGVQGKGFRAGAQNTRDSIVAREQGIDVDMLRTRRALRNKISAIRTDPNADSIDNQIKVAQEAVRLANEAGDSETAIKALQQLTSLRAQKIELSRLGLQEESQKTAVGQDRLNFLQDANTGVAVRKVEDSEDASPSGAVLISDGDDPDFGKWRVSRPDGTIEILSGNEIVPFGSLPNSGLPGKFRGKSAVDVVKGQYGVKGFSERRDALLKTKTQAKVISDIADLFSEFGDPGIIFNFTGKTLIAGDKSLRYLDSMAGLLGGEDGKKVTWNGKAVSSEQQRDQALDTAEKALLQKYGVKDLGGIVPPEAFRGAMAAEQYWAMVMELAFLDAALLEPSNRGLSDKDILAALKRLAADTANPESFARRQVQWIDNQLAKVQNLGIEVTPDHGYDKEELVEAMYSPALVDDIETSLINSRDKLTAQVSRIRGASAPVSVAPEGAIDLLRSDPSPERIAQFEEIFGEGTAEKVLGNVGQ